MNKVYKNLNSINFLKKSYHLKFLFIVFIGIHIPLISIIIYTLYNEEVSKTSIIIISLLFTLIATAITLIILRNLLDPLLFSRKALEEYLNNQTIPVLPENYDDEAGILMNLIQKSVKTMDSMIQEKEQITALLSHNLRIPFNQIKGLCEVLEVQKPLNVKVIENINLVCDNQLKNINELLYNINNQINKDAIFIEPFSLKKFIQTQINLVLSELSKKQINIKTEFPENDIIIHTEEKKLALVLQNLITNALKFSFPGKTISIFYKEVDSKINIVVKDEGIGLPDNYSKKIFSASAKIGRVGTAGEPSNGIGLSLCKKTMQQLGGDLKASSEGENKGAEFTIII